MGVTQAVGLDEITPDRILNNDLDLLWVRNTRTPLTGESLATWNTSSTWFEETSWDQKYDDDDDADVADDDEGDGDEMRWDEVEG